MKTELIELKTLVKNLEQEIKKINKKNWLTKLETKLNELGYKTLRGNSICQGITSGTVTIINNKKVRIYSWGSARGKFYSQHEWLEVMINV